MHAPGPQPGIPDAYQLPCIAVVEARAASLPGLLRLFRGSFTSPRLRDKIACPLSTPSTPPDFEKGFIRAETVAYDDYVAAGGFGTAKEKGLLRLEGKDYVVKEGDIMLFRFNV